MDGYAVPCVSHPGAESPRACGAWGVRSTHCLHTVGSVERHPHSVVLDAAAFLLIPTRVQGEL